MYELAKVSLNNKGNEIRSAERSLEGEPNVDYDVKTMMLVAREESPNES